MTHRWLFNINNTIGFDHALPFSLYLHNEETNIVNQMICIFIPINSREITLQTDQMVKDNEFDLNLFAKDNTESITSKTTNYPCIRLREHICMKDEIVST